MKLQLYVQQVNGALEETSQSVLSGLPRVLRDTQVLQQEALLLREKMVTVKQEIAKVSVDSDCISAFLFPSKFIFILYLQLFQVENDTGLSMANLERIDRIKTDLQTAKQGLHEADNWTVLANDVEEVLLKLNFQSKNCSFLIIQTILFL